MQRSAIESVELIAFVASFFGPTKGAIEVSCRNPLPSQFADQVLQSLGDGDRPRATGTETPP